MKPSLFVLAGLALLTTAGCRSDPAVPILERQLRLQEDEIYRLRATLDQMQDCGPSCSERAPRGAASSAEPEAAAPRHRHGAAASNGEQPPMAELPSESTTEPPDLLKTPAGSLPPGVPEVPKELQGPSKPFSPREHGPGDRSSKDGPSLELGMERKASRSGRATLASQSPSAVPFTPSGDSRQVAAVVLDRTLTGGISAETGAGDQGLLVVVEPRDRAGRTMDAPAEMSVVVIDPALEGNAARVARWDFTAAETAAMFRRSGTALAIHLTTAWPGDPPAHHKLHLFVRYVTADGRKLQADQPIEVALSGDRTTRWTPSDSPAQTDRAAERQASGSRDRSETPTVRIPGPTPQNRVRADQPEARRPVWSPERL